MVKWTGIEDNGSRPTRVWLSRTKPEDDSVASQEEWKPLRKVDCKALNDEKSGSVKDGHHPVLIESGRATADPSFGIIRANFVHRPLRELTSCTWFVVLEERKDPQTGKLKPVLEPMPDEHSETAEALYQKAIHATSIYGDGIEPLLKERMPLVRCNDGGGGGGGGGDAERSLVVAASASSGSLNSSISSSNNNNNNSDYHVEVQKHGVDHYVMKKVPNGWFAKSYTLQRGHGSYVSEGEEEELALGPVNHVVFVVHGIGEAWFSKDKTTSMVETMDQLRLVFQKRQVADWKKKCDAAKKKRERMPDPPNRVEFLPILWYDKVHDSSNDMTKSLKGVTLSTIPALRSIANDVVLDVLLYMTPSYCHEVLESVTDQIFSVYGTFNKTFPDFGSRGGKCSLIGHSLGSVICWDLLSLKKNSLQTGDNEHGVHIEASRTARNSANVDLEGNANGGGAWGPSLPRPFEKVIPFQPEFTMFIGSPIGLFLSLRGGHPVFDSIRDAHPEKPLVSPFTLPTKAVYNIFSPSDPVAYRIEPLLLAQGTQDLPDPLYLTRLGEGVRFHVKAMQIGDGIRDGIRKGTWSLFGGSSKVSKIMDGASGKEKQAAAAPDSDKAPQGGDGGTLRFPLGGRTDRLDYQLQPGVIDNEYISAVTAHSTYFHNTDVIDFLIDVTDSVSDTFIDLTTGDDA